MRKQILLLALMIFSGVFITSDKENGLKACAGNATAGNKTAGLSMKTCKMLKMQQPFMEDADASYNMFMNPFDRQ